MKMDQQGTNRIGSNSRLFTNSFVDSRKDEYEEKYEKGYQHLQSLISGITSDKQIIDTLTTAINREKGQEELISYGLLTIIFTEPESADKAYQQMRMLTRDNLQWVVQVVGQVILERYHRMSDGVRTQMIWLVREIVKNSVPGADNMCWNLMRHAASGDLSAKNLHLIDSLLDIYQQNRKWLVKFPWLVASVVYTYLRLLEDHTAPHGHVSKLRAREVSLVVSLLRDRFSDCFVIGRDLVRLLQNVARIPEIEALWNDILKQPTSLAPNFTGVVQLLQARTSRRFLQSRLTPDMEKKLVFFTSSVRFGNHKRYQEWFHKQYLSTAESQSLRSDLIRFIVGVIHPTNELLCSDIIPRWAVIGWLITTCNSAIALANAKLALFYDWFCFQPQRDNIMNIEPAILVMSNSLKTHVSVTASLLDFLCRIIPNFCPPYSDAVRQGIVNSFYHIVEKRVLSSLLPLFEHPKLDTELKAFIRQTFAPDFFDSPQPPVIPAPFGASSNYISNTSAPVPYAPKTVVNNTSSNVNSGIPGNSALRMSIEDEKDDPNKDPADGPQFSEEEDGDDDDEEEDETVNESVKHEPTNSYSQPTHLFAPPPAASSNFGSRVKMKDKYGWSMETEDNEIDEETCEAEGRTSSSELMAALRCTCDCSDRRLRQLLCTLASTPCSDHNARCEAMENIGKILCSVTCTEKENSSSDSIGIESLKSIGRSLSIILRMEIDEQKTLPSCPLDLENKNMEDGVKRPLQILVSAFASQYSSTNSKRIPFYTVLTELHSHKPKFGYLLLYYLIVNEFLYSFYRDSSASLMSSSSPFPFSTFIKPSKSVSSSSFNNSPSVKVVLYKELCTKRGDEKKFEDCILSDLKLCQMEDEQMFGWLVPFVYKEFASTFTSTASETFLHLVVSSVDAGQLHSILCAIISGEITIVDDDSLLTILTNSLKWETFEQICLWKLVRAQHGLSLQKAALSLLPKLDSKQHTEALLAITLLLFDQQPTEELLKPVLCRELKPRSDVFASSVLSSWANRHCEYLASTISQLLLSRCPNASTSSSPSKRRRPTAQGQGLGAKSAVMPPPSAERILGHLDRARDGCRAMLREPAMRKALEVARLACTDTQALLYRNLFAAAVNDGEPPVELNANDLVATNATNTTNATKRGRKPAYASRPRSAAPSRSTLKEISDSETESSAEEEGSKQRNLRNSGKKRRRMTMATVIVSDDDSD